MKMKTSLQGQFDPMIFLEYISGHQIDRSKELMHFLGHL